MAATLFRPRPLAALLVIIVTGTGLVVGPARAQTLAEVAKKEEERRKTLSAPAKVYTNKDLTALPAGSAPPPPAAAAGLAAKLTADQAKAAADKAAKDDAAKEGEPAKDQAYWSGRMKTLKDKLERDQTYVDAMQTRVNSLTADAINRDDPAQRTVLERDRQKAVAELARLNQDIANGKKAIAELEEEARRTGVPPGWLR